MRISLRLFIWLQVPPIQEVLNDSVCFHETNACSRARHCADQRHKIRPLNDDRINFLFSPPIRLMYPIDFSETRKKKNVAKPFVLPKLPAYAWAIVAVPVVLLCLGVLCMDYLSVRHAETLIDAIEVAALVDGTRQQRKIRKITGFSPTRKTRSGELIETYTFSRILPFSPRTATVVYTSSGRITEVLRNEM